MTLTASIKVTSARYGVSDAYQPMALLLGEAEKALHEAHWYAQQAEGHCGYDDQAGCIYVYEIR